MLIRRRDGSEHTVLYDAEDALVVDAHPWHVCRTRVSGLFYVTTTIGNRKMPMQRLLTGLAGVDHINHNGLDNRRANLRPATSQQNSGNRRPCRGSSVYRGVTRHKSGWQASIAGRYLGLFQDEAEAARAWDAAARERWAEFAYQNLPIGEAS